MPTPEQENSPVEAAATVHDVVATCTEPAPPDIEANSDTSCSSADQNSTEDVHSMSQSQLADSERVRQIQHAEAEIQALKVQMNPGPFHTWPTETRRPQDIFSPHYICYKMNRLSGLPRLLPSPCFKCIPPSELNAKRELARAVKFAEPAHLFERKSSESREFHLKRTLLHEYDWTKRTFETVQTCVRRLALKNLDTRLRYEQQDREKLGKFCRRVGKKFHLEDYEDSWPIKWMLRVYLKRSQKVFGKEQLKGLSLELSAVMVLHRAVWRPTLYKPIGFSFKYCTNYTSFDPRPLHGREAKDELLTSETPRAVDNHNEEVDEEYPAAGFVAGGWWGPSRIAGEEEAVRPRRGHAPSCTGLTLALAPLVYANDAGTPLKHAISTPAERPLGGKYPAIRAFPKPSLSECRSSAGAFPNLLLALLPSTLIEADSYAAQNQELTPSVALTTHSESSASHQSGLSPAHILADPPQQR
ncbi:hypothetical protein C8R46DRAFT_1044811 [Mycena filopes]|nr:hypothetical protein C8R46DRAFT_1044811 [Mycena filopes]